MKKTKKTHKGTISVSKAKEILKHGEVKGHKLTPRQRRFFGYVIGKGKSKNSKKKSDGYKRYVDNKMRNYGDIDEKKKIIRIRKKPFKAKKWEKGEVLNTILHEENHRIHPKMHEKTIYKKTKRDAVTMSRYLKNKAYSKYRKTLKKKKT